MKIQKHKILQQKNNKCDWTNLTRKNINIYVYTAIDKLPQCASTMQYFLILLLLFRNHTDDKKNAKSIKNRIVIKILRKNEQKAYLRESLLKFQQNFVKNSILTKNWKKQKKEKQNLIVQVKRWFSTRLEIFNRFKHFRIKIISAASIAPNFFLFNYSLQQKIK